MAKKTHCEKWIETNEKGTPNYKKGKQKKMVHLSLEGAIKACEKLNALPKRVYMVEPYECDVCGEIHIGRSGKKIGEEYRAELAQKIEEMKALKARSLEEKILSADLKIVGKIDLSKFDLSKFSKK